MYFNSCDWLNHWFPRQFLGKVGYKRERANDWWDTLTWAHRLEKFDSQTKIYLSSTLLAECAGCNDIILFDTAIGCCSFTN